MLAGAAEDHELAVGQRPTQRMRVGAEQRLALRRPAEAVRRAHRETVEHDAVCVAGPERLGDGEAVPDPVQKLTADGVEAHARKLAREVVGRRAVLGMVAPGFDGPGPRDGGI